MESYDNFVCNQLITSNEKEKNKIEKNRRLSDEAKQNA